MSYVQDAGLGAPARLRLQRRGHRGYAGLAGPVVPTDGARAAVDAWIAANPGYGTQSVAPWALDADGSTVTVPTDNGQSVRFGFGRGVLAAFPPSSGILGGGASPVAVQPAVTAPQIVAPALDVPTVSPATAAVIAASNGAVIAPADIPAEPQPSAPTMEDARTVPTTVVPSDVAAAATTGLSTPLLIGLAALAAFLLFRKS
jgi:hypothetical protein